MDTPATAAATAATTTATTAVATTAAAVASAAVASAPITNDTITAILAAATESNADEAYLKRFRDECLLLCVTCLIPDVAQAGREDDIKVLLNAIADGSVRAYIVDLEKKIAELKRLLDVMKAQETKALVTFGGMYTRIHKEMRDLRASIQKRYEPPPPPPSRPPSVTDTLFARWRGVTAAQRPTADDTVETERPTADETVETERPTADETVETERPTADETVETERPTAMEVAQPETVRQPAGEETAETAETARQPAGEETAAQPMEVAHPPANATWGSTDATSAIPKLKIRVRPVVVVPKCPVCDVPEGRHEYGRGKRRRMEDELDDQSFFGHAMLMSFDEITRFHGFSTDHWLRRSKALDMHR